ncbi:MAG: hypothetical protein R3C56_02665 [Pirellulaceae bacterium]
MFGREVPDIGLLCRLRSGHLSDQWGFERPVFVTLTARRYLLSYLGLLKSTVEQVGSSGDRYQMVVISFDMRDRPEDLIALAKYHNLRTTQVDILLRRASVNKS